jgi:hypothetical protein
MNSTDSQNTFTQALSIAQQMRLPFTDKLPINSFDEINDIGQVYFKPIAVFVDSGCYSACDTFASLIQDYKVGTVFGEEQTTGGGGANTFSLNEVLDRYGDIDSGPFKKLYNGQNISFAFRQSFRSGMNTGMLIEDKGIKVDQLSPLSMSDLFNGTNDQLLVLQKFMKSQGPRYSSYIFFENNYEDRQDFVVNQKAKIKASWNDTTSLEFKMNGNGLEKRDIPNKGVNVEISLPARVDTKTIGQGRLEILGTKAETRVWRKILNYRVIPESTKLAPNQTLKINLKDENALAFYTHNTLKKDGWNISGDSLYLGDGSRYSDLSHAEASLFITLPQIDYEFKFAAIIRTEPEFDFMKVIAISEGKEFVLIEKLSGDIPMTDYKINLGQFKGKAVEIRFVFESEDRPTGKGITIKNIIVAPVSL